jgi:hypothetical protein
MRVDQAGRHRRLPERERVAVLGPKRPLDMADVQPKLGARPEKPAICRQDVNLAPHRVDGPESLKGAITHVA